MPVLVTAFEPFGVITRFDGNPSMTVASRLHKQFGNQAQVAILPTSGKCLPSVRELVHHSPQGILMLGGDIQIANCILELQGATDTGQAIDSPFAHAVAERCKLLGMKTGTVWGQRLYWCLRSYGAALQELASRSTPCVFVHLSYTPFLQDREKQVNMVSSLFDLIAGSH